MSRKIGKVIFDSTSYGCYDWDRLREGLVDNWEDVLTQQINMLTDVEKAMLKDYYHDLRNELKSDIESASGSMILPLDMPDETVHLLLRIYDEVSPE